jgi:hypothetical protein
MSLKVKIILNYSGDLALQIYEILGLLYLYVGPYIRVLTLLIMGILTLTKLILDLGQDNII